MAKRIEVSGLNVYYGDFKAVEDVSMTIEPRSVTAFIGPSGCGKSTFLRTLNRMHEVIPGARVEGKVMLDQQDLYATGIDPVAVRRVVGMVFQRPNPFPTMSIFDNVASGLKLNGVKDRKKLTEVVERSLHGANLWNEVKDRLDKPGAGLSGGQQQRLCIARAIAVEPQVAAYADREIVIDGQDLYGSEIDPVEVRRQVGMVFQRPNPFPTMSIGDNVLAGSRLNSKKIPKAKAQEIIEKSLRGANLWTEVKDRLNKPGMGLSGGQQQRLCIARAIAVEPQVLLMDEPCSALDPISTSAIEDLIHELKTDYTIVIVTHNMQQAARVSDETGFFNLAAAGKPGELVEMNPTAKIFGNPDEKATEAYISGRFG